MLFDNIHFNKVRDIQEVDQFGFVDLREAFMSHTIPSDLSPDEKSFNEIDDPRGVSGKPRDIFEAIEAGANIISSAANTSSEKESGD